MNKLRFAFLAIAVGAVVLVLKLLAYLTSGSVALLSDALESIINIVASVMMMFSIWIAAKPADLNHNYGHKKAENISALIEGLLIIIAAVLIIEASVGRLLAPEGLGNVDLALLISLSATSLNGILAIVLLRASGRTGSIALEGDAKHLMSDVFSSVGVVIGLFIASLTGWFILDPLIALVVASLLIRMGYSVLRKTSEDLMDQSCQEEERLVREVLARVDGYIEYHDLKTRKVGNQVFSEFHLCVDGSCSTSCSHALAEKIELEIGKVVPDITVTIHVETQAQAVGNKVSI